MALAYWAYPHRDIKSAEKVIAYPDPWRHAQPGIQLPANWPTANLDANGRLKPNSPEGWNTQHNTDGKLENPYSQQLFKAAGGYDRAVIDSFVDWD